MTHLASHTATTSAPVTQWFNLSDAGLPVHAGLYEYRYVDQPDRLLLMHVAIDNDGRLSVSGMVEFFHRSYDADGRLRIAIGCLNDACIEWRGLADKPEVCQDAQR